MYEAIFEENETKGVYAISLVENPAMEDEWITLSEDIKDVKLAAIDDAKNILLGAVLIPNKRILRNINGNEFEMKLSEKTIEQLAHNFQKQSYQNNSTLEHELKLSDVSFVETWIVEDSLNDKSNAFGKTYPKGTWVAMSKVSDEVYAKAKSGEIKGFSIDGILKLNEVKFKNQMSMSTDAKSITDAIRDGFKAIFNEQKQDVKLEEDMPLEDMPIEKEMAEEFDMDGFKSMLEQFLASFKKEVEGKIETVKAEFSKENQNLKNENENLKVELSKAPEAAPIKHRGETLGVQLSSKGRMLELMRNK
jgi:hypothetical protein